MRVWGCVPNTGILASPWKESLDPHSRIESLIPPGFLKRKESWLSLGEMLGLIFQDEQRGVGIRKLDSSPGSTTCRVQKPCKLLKFSVLYDEAGNLIA